MQKGEFVKVNHPEKGEIVGKISEIIRNKNSNKIRGIKISHYRFKNSQTPINNHPSIHEDKFKNLNNKKTYNNKPVEKTITTISDFSNIEFEPINRSNKTHN